MELPYIHPFLEETFSAYMKGGAGLTTKNFDKQIKIFPNHKIPILWDGVGGS